MRKLFMLIPLLVLAALAQNPSPIQSTGVAPSGACGSTNVRLLVPNGTIYTCQNGVWAPVSGGGGGSGTVTNIATALPVAGGPITTTGTISCPTCVVGPGSATSGHIATFNGTTGLLIQDGGAPATGTVTSIATTAPIAGGPISTTGTITCNVASGSQPGCLSSADWATFNGKGSGTVTSVATTSPLGGGTISTTGTLTCATCVVATVNPGVGVGHFAGSTQTITSSVVTLAEHATQAADTVVQNATGSSAAPTAVAMPTCTTGADLYNTSTHSWSCVSLSSGAFVLVEEHTASSSNTLDFTTCFTSTYDDYVFRATSLVVGTNNANLQMLVSSNGGSTYISTGYAYIYQVASVITASATLGPADSNSVNGASFMQLADTITNTEGYGLNGQFDFHDPLNASLKKSVETRFSYSSGSANRIWMGLGSAFYGVAVAINAVRFQPSTGNFTSGTIRCYGIAK